MCIRDSDATALNALLYAIRARTHVLGATHGVGNPAADFGRIGGFRRERREDQQGYGQEKYTLHEEPPGETGNEQHPHDEACGEFSQGGAADRF